MTKQIIGELEHTKKYIPKSNEEYYYLSEYGIARRTHYDCSSDSKWIIGHQPVFRTPNDCRIYKRYLDLLDEYTFEPDWNDDGQQKHYICYSHNKSALEVDYYWGLQTGMYNFESEEKAREFIGKVGEQNVKRFMFDMWE